MSKKTKPLIYPFTFNEWLSHPSTKPKLKWCKQIASEIKYGTQKTLNL
jgi:hypothetical protein